MKARPVPALPIALAVAALSATAPSIHAQQSTVSEFLAYGGLGIMIAEPVGEFAEVIGTGWGLEGHLRMLGVDGPLSARLEFGFVEYGRETRRVCLSLTVGCRIEVDLVTSNDILFGSVGPQLGVPSGPIRPYVTAGLGFAYFSTTSSISDVDAGSGSEFSTNNFSDFTWAWIGAAGFTVQLTSGRTPVLLDLAVRYHRNGEAEYLTEDDIVDEPDGSITVFPNRSEANLVTFQLGVSIGFRVGDDDEEPGFGGRVGR